MEAFHSFQAELNLISNAYEDVIFSCVACLHEGKHIVLQSSFQLLNTPIAGFKEFRFTSDSIFACKTHLKYSELQNVLAELQKSASISLSSLKLTLFLLPNKKHKISSCHAPFWSYPNQNWPRTSELQVRGVEVNSLFYNSVSKIPLDYELRAAKTPFDGLDDLLVSLELKPLQNSSFGTTQTTITANTPAMIDRNSQIVNGEANLRIYASKKLDKRKFRVGYRSHSDTQLEDRGCYEGNQIAWEEGVDLVGKLLFSMEDKPGIQVFLSYENFTFDRWWLIDPSKHINVRKALIEAFDPDLIALKTMLSGRSAKPADDFELGVSLLLSMCGFSTSFLGLIPRLTDGPDLIAVTNQLEIMVVECTIDILDNKDKLSKLVKRTAHLREQLTKMGHSNLSVQPVIVSALPLSRLTADLKKAAEQRIAVIANEQLFSWLNTALFPTDASKIFAELQNFIPELSQTNSKIT